MFLFRDKGASAAGMPKPARIPFRRTHLNNLSPHQVVRSATNKNAGFDPATSPDQRENRLIRMAAKLKSQPL